MADNVNIEAKLCSYVEGDLDPAGRAEIERYLQANPQYRSVLEEMTRTRAELRSLPRVKAPIDLQETLSGQLERSALLGDDDVLRAAAGGSRFPHARAWAAVLLLTAALAAVVYSVLPARKPQMADIDQLRKTPVDTEPVRQMNSDSDRMAASVPSLASADAAANKTVAEMTVAPTAVTQEEHAAGPADHRSPSVASPTTAPVAPDATLAPVAAEALAAAASPTTLASANATLTNATTSPTLAMSGDANSIIIPVTDLPTAESQVHQYLQSQNFSFGSTSARDYGMVTTQSQGSGGFTGAMISRAALDDRPEMRTIVVHQLTDAQLQQTRMAIKMPAQMQSRYAMSTAVPGALANGSFDAAQKLLAKGSPAATMALETQFDLTPGEKIQVTAEDTGLGGVAAMDEAMTIDADGNITLPLVGKIRAAGMTPSALSRSIALSYEIAKSPTKANWIIRPIPKGTEPAKDKPVEALSAPSPAASPSMLSGASQTADAKAEPVGASPPATLPTMSVAGEGALSLSAPAAAVNDRTRDKQTLPTTAPVATSAPAEPRNDLTIVLVETAPPPVAPTASPAAPTTSPATATTLPAAVTPATAPSAP